MIVNASKSITSTPDRPLGLLGPMCDLSRSNGAKEPPSKGGRLLPS